MIRRLTAALALTTIALAGGLVACGEPEPEYAAICVDPESGQRLEDDACEDGDDDYLTYAVLWYMAMNSGHPYPAVGHSVDRRYVTTKLPKGARYTTGLSKTGGTSVKSWSTTTRKSGGSSWGTGGSKSTTKSGTGSSGSTGRSSTGRR